MILGPPRLRGQLISTRNAGTCQGLGESNIAWEHTPLSWRLPLTPTVGRCLCQPFALSTPVLAGRRQEHCVLSHELLGLPDLAL